MNSGNEEVREFIVQNFLYGDEGQLEGSTSFLNNGIVDSTGLLELVSFLEGKYGISINDDELIPANLDSLDNIKGLLARKLDSKTPGAASSQSSGGIPDASVVRIP
jgi:acyl carrier protein